MLHWLLVNRLKTYIFFVNVPLKLLSPSGGWKGGQGGLRPRAALCVGRHSEGRKYVILKFGRFWRIGVCIADRQ